MLLYWLPISPDTSASSAVAMGNQAGVSRRVHQRPSLPPNRLSVSLSLSVLLVAVCQAPVHQSGDQGRERRAREEPTGAGTNSERAHQRAQVQVSRANVQRRETAESADTPGRFSKHRAHSHQMLCRDLIIIRDKRC